MKRGGSWLSGTVEKLMQRCERSNAAGQSVEYDVVVVGSGYGGAVAAARLSSFEEASAPGRRLSVCVLERGLEYPAGTFPATMTEMIGHQRVSGAAPLGGQTLPEGLMDWHIGGDVWALVANGLGGGSLINAGVCEPAQDAVLDNTEWPAPWRGNRAGWKRWYDRASHALEAERWPPARVAKQAAMQGLARETGGSARPVHLTITPPQALPPNAATSNPPKTPCIECGDCFTGCNVGAKRTLSHNYLATAWRQGAELHCGATVLKVAKIAQPVAGGARWSVQFLPTDPGLLPGRTAPFEIRARHVVLAAGTFGSTEILMRSRGLDLSLSGYLGQGFSTNGDILSAFHDTEQLVKGSPPETEPLQTRRAGPTITSQIEWPSVDPVAHPSARRDVMQDLTVPGALGWVFREVVTTMMVPQRWTRLNLESQESGQRDIYAVDEKAIAHTLVTVSYADDGAHGRLEAAPGWGGALRDGSLVVRWPKPAQADWFKEADARLASRTPSGSFLLRNPMTQFMPQASYLGISQASSRLLTVHPLGGCRMAESANKGVVDPYGRVFDTGVDIATDRGDPGSETLRDCYDQRLAYAIHEGLHVLDGAIVPIALGINPLLTITALAEGAIDHWMTEYGWVSTLASLPKGSLPNFPVAGPKHPQPEAPTAVTFSERMTGHLPATVTSTCGLLSMRARFDEIPDLRAFLDKPFKDDGFTAVFAVTRNSPNIPATQPLRDETISMPAALELRGRVTWMDIEPSCVGQRFWRSAMTYLRQRFPADWAASAISSQWQSILRAATHFGAVRRLAYSFDALKNDWYLVDPKYGAPVCLPKGTVLFGAKRVGYLIPDDENPESSNPWYQLTHLPLKARLPDGRVRDLATLTFDDMAMIDRFDLPLKVARQHNALTALRDVGSLAFYFGRVMFGLHMLSFRRADYAVDVHGPREPIRLPPLTYAADSRFDSLSVTLYAVPVTLPSGETIRLRLTRVARSNGSASGLPVVLIHGFGSGGIQFTHPKIPQPMAPWLAREQGLDIWVAELRTSIGLPTSERQWVMDDVARQDIPALIEEVCRQTGQEQVKVVAHCIGSAMFCMSALSGSLQYVPRAGSGAAGRQQHASRVAAAVLMQVGPCAVLPRSSRARGYVAMRFQQLLGLDKVSSVASQDPNDTEAIMDRLLGTFLYPVDQRPFYRLIGDRDTNVRRVNANRSAGIFGQLFQYQNMDVGLLDVVEDLLGGCNLSTYEQTAQYAFNGRLTDQRGDDAYVTDDHMHHYFTFPVMFLHGHENQVFAPRTFDKNIELMERLQMPYAAHMVPGFGHLDCVVGNTADRNVFPYIAGHLAAPKVSFAPRVAATEVRLPPVGPWIGHVFPGAAANSLRLRVGLCEDNLGRGRSGIWAMVSGAAVQALAPITSRWQSRGAALGRQRQEFIGEIDIDAPTLQAHLAGSGSRTASLDVLIATVNGTLASDAEFKALVEERSVSLTKDAQRRGVPVAGVPGLRLDTEWLSRQVEAAPMDLGLVLASCRQRPLLVDRDLADRSMRHIHEQLDVAQSRHAPIDALTLVGDQIYADSRADSASPACSSLRFFDAYREAWSATWQREVMRRRPCYMALDDHEFRNDYNDVIARGRPREFDAAREAWTTYQLDAGPPAPRGQPDAAWRSFLMRQFAVFLCDTRTERHDPTTVERKQARIMSRRQMRRLKAWLLSLQRRQAYGTRAKIVVTGCPLAPRFCDQQGNPSELNNDGWQRYPASTAELFGWIAKHQIQNVVFLSGDYHCHVECELSIQGPGSMPLVKARSVVCGGLYSPYPFANVDPEEWLQPAPLALKAGDCTWSYAITQTSSGNGYVRLTFRASGGIDSEWVQTS